LIFVQEFQEAAAPAQDHGPPVEDGDYRLALHKRYLQHQRLGGCGFVLPSGCGAASPVKMTTNTKKQKLRLTSSTTDDDEFFIESF
jgi:hypothetical protein